MTRLGLLNLQAVLAGLFPTNARALEIADQSGLRTEEIEQLARPKSTWWSILREAQRQNRLDELLRITQANYPDHKGLALAAQGALNDAITSPDVAPEDGMQWQVEAAQNEVIVGENELLPAAFLAAGATIAPSVVRISLGATGFGTGFLVAPDLVITNSHVLPSRAVLATATFQVGVEDTLDGIARPGTPYRATPNGTFEVDPVLDLAVARIDPVPECIPISLAASATATAAVRERIFIIQHPGGLPKQVALGINEVVYVDANRVQYLTDTMPGSSGSPLFDARWKLVGVHRRGGWITEPASKRLLFRNEGVPIARVVERFGRLVLGV